MPDGAKSFLNDAIPRIASTHIPRRKYGTHHRRNEMTQKALDVYDCLGRHRTLLPAYDRFRSLDILLERRDEDYTESF